MLTDCNLIIFAIKTAMETNLPSRSLLEYFPSFGLWWVSSSWQYSRPASLQLWQRLLWILSQATLKDIRYYNIQDYSPFNGQISHKKLCRLNLGITWIFNIVISNQRHHHHHHHRRQGLGARSSTVTSRPSARRFRAGFPAGVTSYSYFDLFPYHVAL